MALYLFPFSKTVNEGSHSDDTNTEKHVVFSHSHKLLSVQSRYGAKSNHSLKTGFIISLLGLELINYLELTFFSSHKP